MSDTATEQQASMTDAVTNLTASIQDGSWIDIVMPFLISLGTAILIFVIGFWVVSKIVGMVERLMKLRSMDEALQGFLLAILRTVLKFVVVLIAVEQIGVDTTSLLAILGAAGLAVGLALKDSLSNFAAGVMLIIFKPFKLGDFVDAGGVMGIVEKITVFNTIMRTGDNREIIVPNAHIYGGVITNFSARATRRIDLVIGVGYGDDLKKARQLMMDVMDKDERILKDPAVTVGLDELGDSSVNFVVRPWVKAEDYWATKWDLLETFKAVFDENGISIPYPQRDVHVHNVEAK